MWRVLSLQTTTCGHETRESGEFGERWEPALWARQSSVEAALDKPLDRSQLLKARVVTAPEAGSFLLRATRTVTKVVANPLRVSPAQPVLHPPKVHLSVARCPNSGCRRGNLSGTMHS
jgi:hypothetical protein